MIGCEPAPCEAAVIRGPARPAAVTAAAPRWVLAAAVLGSSLATIDGSVVNLALPVIQRELHATIAGMQWVINGYLLVLGSLVLVGGSTGDRFGRRRVFTLGILAFTFASVICALAPDLPTLIGARLFQGAGGALLVPNSLALISASFDDAHRSQAIGTWAGTSALMTAVGPLLGGVLVDTWSWRAIFLVNVPLAAVALAITARHVPESRGEQQEGALDWRGASLCTAGLALVVWGLTTAPQRGWLAPTLIAAVVAGVLLLAGFVFYEQRAAAPMMPLQLFRSRTFTGANSLTLLLYFALGGAMFLVPFNLIGVQGYSATLAGMAFLPFTVVMAGMSGWAGRLVSRHGARRPLIIGPATASAGLALFAVPGAAGSYWTTVFPAMIVLGVGMALSAAPLTTAVMGSVDVSRAGVASGINNAVARIGSLLAVAILGAVLVVTFGSALNRRLDDLRVPPQVRRVLNAQVPRLAEAAVPSWVAGDARETLDRSIDDAFVHAYRVVMLIAAAAALLSALCAVLTIDGHDSGRDSATAHAFSSSARRA